MAVGAPNFAFCYLGHQLFPRMVNPLGYVESFFTSDMIELKGSGIVVVTTIHTPTVQLDSVHQLTPLDNPMRLVDPTGLPTLLAEKILAPGGLSRWRHFVSPLLRRTHRISLIAVWGIWTGHSKLVHRTPGGGRPDLLHCLLLQLPTRQASHSGPAKPGSHPAGQRTLLTSGQHSTTDLYHTTRGSRTRRFLRSSVLMR